MASRLDGDWQVLRTGGLLPPLVGVRKHIMGEEGWTSLGPFPGAAFDVVGSELRYRSPFQGLVDVVEQSPEGYHGRVMVFGRELGTFRMLRRRSSAPDAAADAERS
jgi:hypothetical protein